MEFLGHADIATTMIYADYCIDQSNGRAMIERVLIIGCRRRRDE